ncbi:MAG TPA: Rieske 2Fe-2S domain-containing protein, partial [Arenicellales bacterium]|nr:Rieske 2Fe-2S domain-containing protein [Arenicellales bacterium]
MTLRLTENEFDHISQGYDPVASRSGSIHSDCYLDARFLDVEREQVFHRTWQFVCHEEKLREPGSYVAGDVQGQSIFVARDSDGELRAFYNVCRHRGHELLSGEGQ